MSVTLTACVVPGVVVDARVLRVDCVETATPPRGGVVVDGLVVVLSVKRLIR
jgi:hypothetical protein